MKCQLILLSLVAILSSCNQHTVRRSGFEVHGIDVSHHQKHIDWKTVASQNVHFVFVKATEGESLQDSLFCRNWIEAKQAGIKRGAYHFLRPAVSAHSQAENFLSRVEMENGDLPPVLDVEVLDGVSDKTLLAGVEAWLQIVEDQLKIKPILYTNQKFFNRFLAGQFNSHPIWIARYSYWRKPCLNTGRDWNFWQYGNKGKLKGIEGDVDFNVFQGTLSELELYSFFEPVPDLTEP
jgi:lysozyme